MIETIKTQPVNIAATVILGFAILHTFLTSYFQKIARKFEEGSFFENFFHLLGEVEVVFGLWCVPLVGFLIANHGWTKTLEFIDQINFNEPIFVFCIMTVASTKPVIEAAQRVIIYISSKFPNNQTTALYFSCLTLGPLLGSFITEPAAMTVTALVLLSQFYNHNVSNKFKYTTLAILFVNVSIGGVLTHYAAPPILMVADTWGWDTSFMFFTFGWKALIAVFINTGLASVFLYNELSTVNTHKKTVEEKSEYAPWGIVLIHIVFLVLIVLTSHHSSFCLGLLLFFIGFTTSTSEYQSELKIRESLLVAFFLAGLVILGQFQGWWLSPLLERLETFPLFLGATALTAITDNAALTFLGSQTQNVSEIFKYALVAGAVAGGGLTIIANAPNPAGASILQKSFGQDGIKPGKLFIYALLPTLIVMFCFWIL